MTFGRDPHAVAGVHEGDVIAGKYRVDRILGSGGMGVVVAARHMQLEEAVALKFLRPEAVSNPEATARFLREARAAVKIKSEHVARVTDVGTLPSGAPYMVMEYLDGGDLGARLQQRGVLPVEQAVDFVLQACVAMAEAHGLGIVHRDLKPANLFCTRRADGQLFIKVLDFGISKVTDLTATQTAGAAMTQTSALMGSPFYMSPEQMRSSKDVDLRTDIWAVGVVLFQLLTGELPFFAATITEVAFKVWNEPPPSLRSHRPDAPPGLEAVVFKCLEKDRERRYRNVGELAIALLPFAPKPAKGLVERISGIVQASGMSESALVVPPSDAPAAPQGRVETIPALGTTAPSSRGSRAVTGSLVGIGVVVLGGGVAAFGRFAGKPSGADAGALFAPQSARGASLTAPVEAAADGCMNKSTRCDGTTPLTCTDGLWVSAPVEAGRCSADCTPKSSPSRCKDNTPQTCTPAGKWQDSAPCRKTQVCRDGVCVAGPSEAPAPPPPHPIPPHPTPSFKPTEAPSPSTSPPSPSPTSPAAPSCRVVKEFDGEGNVHFKQVCN